MLSSLKSILNAGRSPPLLSLLARSHGDLASSRPLSSVTGKFGSQRFSASSGLSSGKTDLNRNVPAPFASKFLSSFHSSCRKDSINRGETGNAMNFVRRALEEDDDSDPYNVERSVDFVHIKVLRNNSFVTVTDSKGNKKFGFSNGSLPDKGGAKYNRYSAEAVSEHVGRVCRNMGMKSVVMKVNGQTFFKKKKQAIMSWREGFTNSRTDQSPVVCIEDTTRKPHNGCRLPRKRRV